MPPRAGESIADIVNGMNTALAAAGIDASAALVGSAGTYQVQLASAAYGSAATFQVAASGSDQLGLISGGSTYTGTDVAGTINGLAAVGSGQYLSSYNSGDNADGLVVQVTTPGITSATALGTVTYAPGFGQGLAHIAATASLAPNGIIPVTIAGLQGTLAEVGSEISMQQQLVATQQAALTAEFTNMETTLSRLQSESSFLNQAFGGGSSSNSSSSSLGSASTSSSRLLERGLRRCPPRPIWRPSTAARPFRPPPVRSSSSCSTTAWPQTSTSRVDPWRLGTTS